MDDLLQQGVAAYRSGNREEARKLFVSAIKQDKNDERTWGWMYNVAVNDQERKSCLEQMIRINPQNEKAKSLLSDLLGLDPPLEKPVSNPVPTPVVQPIQTSEEPQITYPPTNQKNVIIGCLAVLMLLIVCAVAWIAFINNATPDTAEEYFEQYGGSLQAYQEIFSLTDCQMLQEKFDIATANNDREPAGSEHSKITLGYMLAASNRLEKFGCYK